jgi:hypothetical protein
VAIMAKDSGGRDFKPMPAGVHLAICNAVVDLGIQQTTYKGEAKSQHQVYLRWEVPDETVEYEKDGRKVVGPATIGRTYTLSLSEKANLRKVLENWRGKPFTADELKGFDITNVAGKCCQIMVQHDTRSDKTYANVTGVMGVSRDQAPRARELKPANGVLVYALDDHDPQAFDALPKWIKEKLAERVPAQSAKTANAAAPAGDVDFNDDIPC